MKSSNSLKEMKTGPAAYARYTGVFVGLAIVVFLLVVWNINSGSVHIPVREIARIISGENITDTALRNASEMLQIAQNT